MEKSRFLELEFVTLRKEIEEANTRAFQLMLGGVTVIPGIQYLAKTFELDAITLGLPMLILVIALLFLAQNLTIMRAGRYIREQIEPFIPDIVGWEAWLEKAEQGPGRRIYDKLLTNSFYLLYLMYYCFSVYLARMAAAVLFSGAVSTIILVFYSAVGIGMVFLIFWNLQTSTSTGKKTLPIKSREKK
jgi:hypothetical protein